MRRLRWRRGDRVCRGVCLCVWLRVCWQRGFRGGLVLVEAGRWKTSMRWIEGVPS